MKKSFFLTSGVLLAFLLLLAPACNDSNDSDNTGCDGVAWATSTGFLTRDFCFNSLGEYYFEGTDGLSFTGNEVGDVTYSLIMDLVSYNGPGTYSLDQGDRGVANYAELVVHGDPDSEFYKATTGSITVEAADDAVFKATFSFTAVGYYNGETISLSGTIDKK